MFPVAHLAAMCTRNEWKIESHLFPARFQVFPLLVKVRLKKWPECGQRKVRWFRVPEAAAVIDDGDLRKLILQLNEHRRASHRKNKNARYL